jgi:ABC-type sugar transport system ATPase subunit
MFAMFEESDCVAVMDERAIIGLLAREKCSEEAIMRLAVGPKDSGRS